MKPTVIDLFAGVGGLSLDFEQAGFHVVLANEYDDEIATAYRKNHPEIKMVVGDITALDLENTFGVFSGKIDVIIGGPPCQGFSQKGHYFSYSLGGKIYNYSELAMAGGYATNQYRYMLDAWHPVRNPDSDLPRAGTDDRLVPSSLQVHDASYLRLKNATVSYTFDLRKKTRLLRDITLAVTGENLWLWTKYNGFDPDVSSEGTSSTLRRVDMGAYPRSRMFVFSIQLRY